MTTALTSAPLQVIQARTSGEEQKAEGTARLVEEATTIKFCYQKFFSQYGICRRIFSSKNVLTPESEAECHAAIQTVLLTCREEITCRKLANVTPSYIFLRDMLSITWSTSEWASVCLESKVWNLSTLNLILCTASTMQFRRLSADWRLVQSNTCLLPCQRTSCFVHNQFPGNVRERSKVSIQSSHYHFNCISRKLMLKRKLKFANLPAVQSSYVLYVRWSSWLVISVWNKVLNNGYVCNDALNELLWQKCILEICSSSNCLIKLRPCTCWCYYLTKGFISRKFCRYPPSC